MITALAETFVFSMHVGSRPHVLAFAVNEAMVMERVTSDNLREAHGVYHHVSRGHLNRYCDEFAFRYQHRTINDGQRAKLLVAGAEGKRLTYKQPA